MLRCQDSNPEISRFLISSTRDTIHRTTSRNANNICKAHRAFVQEVDSTFNAFLAEDMLASCTTGLRGTCRESNDSLWNSVRNPPSWRRLSSKSRLHYYCAFPSSSSLPVYYAICF